MPALEKRSLTIHGHEVAYRFGGPEIAEGAPVLLLIHGMAGSSATWRDVGPALAKGHTVVAPDLLGHGASAKPRHDYSLGAFASGLRDLLVALRIDRATVVGQSLGGGIAMQFAYQHPERCERLVLVNSGGLGPDVSWILRALTLPLLQRLNADFAPETPVAELSLDPLRQGAALPLHVGIALHVLVLFHDLDLGHAHALGKKVFLHCEVDKRQHQQ